MSDFFPSSTFLFLVYTAIQGIIDATNEQLNEIEKECAGKNKVCTASIDRLDNKLLMRTISVSVSDFRSTIPIKQVQS